MRQDSFDKVRWDAWANDPERSDTQRVLIHTLDAYFQSRENLPGKSYSGEQLVEDNKTSQEIADDLQGMIGVPPTEVAIYMEYHNFQMTTLEDGTVAWAIWRDMRPLM